MKKILLFILLGVISFSNCKYISDPNSNIRAFIDTVKEEKLENKLYCNDYKEKMVYYLDDEINIGLVYKVKTLDWVSGEELEKKIKEFSNDVGKILDNKRLKSKNLKFSHENYVRMYLEDEEDILMILRIPLTVKEETRIYYNSDLSDWGFGNLDGYYPTDDVVY